jgi:hypothetical protein
MTFGGLVIEFVPFVEFWQINVAAVALLFQSFTLTGFAISINQTANFAFLFLFSLLVAPDRCEAGSTSCRSEP